MSNVQAAATPASTRPAGVPQVWGAGVGLWRLQVAGGTIGEAWVSPTSEYQLLGFALLLLGTIIYAQVPLRT